MEKTINILFTSVGRRVELIQMFRSASEQMGLAISIYGTDIVSTAPAMFYCDHTCVVPRISDPDYIPTLLELCEKKKITLLIPTIDTDLLLLAENKDRFQAIGTRTLISDVEKIAICRDKRNTTEFFRSAGLHAPDTVDDAERYTGGYPAFLKPKDGSSSIDTYVVNSEEELISCAKKVQNCIIQPYISGTEYTVDVFCDFDGKPIFITPRIRRAIRGGEVLKTEIRQDEKIIRDIDRLIERFRPCGPITVQLIRDDSTGTDWYIEINPRFGGGAPLSMKAGADSAEALLRLLNGEAVTTQIGAASDHAFYSRFDQSVPVPQNTVHADRIDAVIFDLDDTLYLENDYIRSGFHAVAENLSQIADAEGKLWEAFQSGQPAIDTVLQNAGITDPSLRECCLMCYRNHKPNLSLKEDTKILLTKLREAGKKIGIITDGRPSGQRNKITAMGLENYVDEIIITDELGGPQFRKPNTIAFQIMHYRLGIPYERMAYVGDNIKKDCQAPQMLGMPFIYYRNSDGLYFEENSIMPIVVQSMSELSRLFFG